MPSTCRLQTSMLAREFAGAIRAKRNTLRAIASRTMTYFEEDHLQTAGETHLKHEGEFIYAVVSLRVLRGWETKIAEVQQQRSS